ncbi:hypothetical protein ACJD0Z_01610 [Flavobacteriaceae bacterium M23B6Z8]
MKKLLVMLALFTANVLMAQEGLNTSEIASFQTSVMKTELALSEEQSEKVATINQLFTEEQVTLMNEEGSRFSKMGKMRKIMTTKNEKLNEVLNESQMRKYKDELLPRFRKHFRSKMNK